MTKNANQVLPERVLGRRRAVLLRSDIHTQWAQWFVEGLADPSRYLEKSYPHIFADVHAAVNRVFPDCTKPERLSLAQTAARFVENSASAIRKLKQRVQADREQRIVLLDLSGNPPRCWICGLRFCGEATENFRNGNAALDLPSPPFLDILKPIGLKPQDLRIEADHVYPFSHGGGDLDNLRLSCGWCNRYKSSLQSLYEVEGRPISAAPNKFGFTTLPQRFWTVRTLATQRSCEHPDGCTASCDDHEMTIAPINDTGALNPGNLRVVCPEHDPYGNARLQHRDAVAALWSQA
ncbi:HNH endonuclease [Burkholderia pseudomallei]|nr:HNH endonuclease [Burkholderia pseudomallei]